MTVGGNSMGGLTVGFESMMSTVLPGSSVDLNAYTSVRSSRVSSPGNLRLSALKWLDIVTPLGGRFRGPAVVGLRTGAATKRGLRACPSRPLGTLVQAPGGARSRGYGPTGAEVAQCAPVFLGSVGGDVGSGFSAAAAWPAPRVRGA